MRGPGLFRRTVINSGVPGWDGGRYETVASKVSSAATGLLAEYTDHVGTAMFQAFADLHQHHVPGSADEIEQALMTLWAVVRELRARYEMVDPSAGG